MGLLKMLKDALNSRDRYHSLRLRHAGLFLNRGRNDRATRGEHASFDSVDRSPISGLQEAGFTANTPDEARERRQEALERERRRRRKVHRRKAT